MQSLPQFVQHVLLASWLAERGSCMPSQYESTRTAESRFPLRWIERGDIPLPARSADQNLVSPPDHHHHLLLYHHHHHHAVPVLLCKIKISSIYYVWELQSHFIKPRSCNRSRHYLSSHVIYIYEHFLSHSERVPLSSTHTCRR